MASNGGIINNHHGVSYGGGSNIAYASMAKSIMAKAWHRWQKQHGVIIIGGGIGINNRGGVIMAKRNNA